MIAYCICSCNTVNDPEPLCSSAQVEYENNEKALYDVRRNKVWGLLHFNENYTRSLANRVSEGTRVQEEDVINSLMSTWVDLSSKFHLDEIHRQDRTSRRLVWFGPISYALHILVVFLFADQYIGNFIRYDVVRSMFSFLKEALSNCGENPKIGSLPLSVSTGINLCSMIYTSGV